MSRTGKTSGFTLVEVLITTAVLVVVMVTVYSAFRTGVAGYRSIEQALRTSQEARNVLERIRVDLRDCFAYSESDARFLGTPEETSFLSLVDTFTKDKVLRAYAFISYRREGDRLLRLCRRAKESLNDASVVLPDEIAAGVTEFRLQYATLDVGGEALVFSDTWTGKKELPVAVKIDLEIGGARFERTIVLPLAKVQNG